MKANGLPIGNFIIISITNVVAVRCGPVGWAFYEIS